MFCYNCGAQLDSTDTCPNCEADVRVIKKIQAVSNRLYNDGLAKAKVRNLSGAIDDLKLSLRYNKMNMDARNLLGLVYFEMGEAVDALSEWVISKSLIPDDNPASEYLRKIQSNNAYLEKLNQTIKKFNQTLLYCRQGNEDLAVIQLKKVVSENPKLVKGQQLLALLYIKAEKYDLAKKCLKAAAKVDKNNITTMTYLQECSEHLKDGGKGSGKEKGDKDTVTYESGNDIIIRPRRFKDNTTLMSVVNILVGAAIGIAVVCFLVIPGVRQRAQNDANSALVQANEQLSTRDQDVQSLQNEIDSLNQQIEEAKASSSSAEDTAAAYDALLKAYTAYSDKDYEQAAKDLDGVNSDLFSDDAKTIYTEVFDTVKDTVLEDQYVSAVREYTNGNYEDAISQFMEIMNTDQSYKDGRAAYYLAHCYYQQKDGTNAAKWFQVVVDQDGASSSIKSESQNCINFINSHKEEYGISDSADGDASGNDNEGNNSDTGNN